MPILLLVGAGHAHLYVVKRAKELAGAGYQLHLLAPRYFDYSGVASATAAGALPKNTGRIDVGALAERSGLAFHEGTLVGLDLQKNIAVTSTGGRVSYDVISLNIGSVVAPAGMQVDPSVMRVKPLSGLAELDDRLTTAGPQAITVIGGGASGVELAAHLSVSPHVTQVRLVDSGPAIGSDLPQGARRRIDRFLHARGVDIHTGSAVREIGAQKSICENGSEIPHDLALLAVGLTAPPLLAEIGLGDERGVPVRATLQHQARDEIYAVGDCARFLPQPLPRIGVHGVRQGPVLYESLLARVEQQPLPVYTPQRLALSILDLGDGVGLAVWGRFWWFGTFALRLKRYIDRRWLKMYQR
ncbi:hypothetical protein EH165_00115 [Nakamurella antarctica]|uniref:FAD/NAD(P)-binding domain-containing protein n=1 Tax=Nakamurella antarctica TaxID=1902245 RepID=A0A3G8ZHE7_9ACTN|nr:FAD-dependent oxidoreductase [Nakamurella antarctica]AZI56812.1 hypothetical protein EH165_00115 [Nakamurella antarctica]